MKHYRITAAAEAAEYMAVRKQRAAEFTRALTGRGGDRKAAIEVVRAARLRRRARIRAREIGLAYWPALAFGPGDVDPAAYVAAERVLRRKTGTLWGEVRPGGPMARGGWDSQGDHGLSPRSVARMWLAAGCRDTPKFRAQVAAGVVARKADSLEWFRYYARGERWVRSNRIQAAVKRWISRKAVAALGRLSAPLRRAALGPFLGTMQDQHLFRMPIRIRDLDWAAVQAAQAAIAGGCSRVEAALSGLRRAEVLLGVTGERAVAEKLAPSYPALTLAMARRLALGESPVALAKDLLTRAEAHVWCTHGAPQDVAAWLCQRLGLPAHRSVRVVRWMEMVRLQGRWSAMERVRQAPGPAGAIRAFSALEVIDEIADEDVTSLTDSVDAVIRRSAERLGEAFMTEAMKDHRMLTPLPSWGRTLPRGMRLLRTPHDLATEGAAMEHCVGGYAAAVQAGQCHVLSICTRHGRSTVELSADLKARQHAGPANRSPPQRHEWLLRAWLLRLAALTGNRRAA